MFASAFFKILKVPEWNKDNSKFFTNHKGYLFQKSPETNMWLLVNHTKPTKTLYWNLYLLTAGSYKSANRQLQNNTINGAMSITINHVIKSVTRSNA